MKKKIFTLVGALLCVGYLGFAAFPVEQDNARSAETTVTVTPETDAIPVISEVQTPEMSQTVIENPSISQKEAANSSNANAAGGKSQIIALVLVVLLGYVGVHRFYLGYTWQGVVQLLTGGGCGIWALIDLVRIITGSLQPKDGSYDKTF